MKPTINPLFMSNSNYCNSLSLSLPPSLPRLRARSHVTTALASQCTAEEDVELHAQWEAHVAPWAFCTRVIPTIPRSAFISGGS